MARNKEGAFQDKLISEIEEMFPGAMVIKNDCSYIQGIPDLTILYNNKWAVLESKRSKNASRRPNQEYYIDKCNKMSFGRFISPENKQEVLRDLQQTFGT